MRSSLFSLIRFKLTYVSGLTSALLGVPVTIKPTSLGSKKRVLMP